MTEQPMPTTTAASQSVTDALIDFLRERQAKGIETYGQSLHTHNGRDANRDALEEAIDLTQYLMQDRMERADLIADRDRLRQVIRFAYTKLGKWAQEQPDDGDGGPEIVEPGGSHIVAAFGALIHAYDGRWDSVAEMMGADSPPVDPGQLDLFEGAAQ